MTGDDLDDHSPDDRRDPVAAIERLSTAHAVLLRLDRSGASHEQMAVALGVPVASIPTLLRVAWGKFHETKEIGP